MTMSSRAWSIASAKAEFSAVVRRAAREPQIIENRGQPVAVVLAFDAYREWQEQCAQNARMQALLRLSAELRAEGGVDLGIPPRSARSSARSPLRCRTR